MSEDPRMARFLRSLRDAHRRQQAQIEALTEKTNEALNENEGNKLELKRLRQALKKAAARIRYIEDIPGKRVPYFLNLEIQVPPGVDANGNVVSIANQVFSDAQPISMDGPFLATHYLASFRAKTYSLGPTGLRQNDPPAGSEVVTPLTGRFRPTASTADPFSGAYIGPSTGVQTLVDASLVNTFRPGTLDFLFEVQDTGTDRQRQNDIATPSRYLFTEFDRPYYLAVSDFYERGSLIRVKVTPTRELGTVEMNYVAYNGLAPGELAPIDPTANNGRVSFAMGGTLTFTLGGYKILQAQTPAV